MIRRQSKERPLGKAVVFSVIAHALVLVAFIAMPSMRFPFKEKPIRIDVAWVELPKGSSDDIGLGLKQAQNLPRSTIEEQKKLFQPEAPQQQTLKPQLTAPADAKPVEKPPEAKNQPRPQIDTSKMIKETPGAKPLPKENKTDKQIKNALAMIDKQLAGRQIVPESSQVSKNEDGYKYGTGDKPLKVPPSDPEYLKYQAMVRAKIIRAWIVPTVYSGETGRYSAQLEVLINDDGEVVSTRWSKTSGNASFDQSAVRAVKNASPFPKPPDRLAWEAYNEGFLIEFDPRMKPQY